VRHRLEAFASSVASEVKSDGFRAGCRSDYDGSAAAAGALLALDLRLVEPHATSLIAAMWAAPGPGDGGGEGGGGEAGSESDGGDATAGVELIVRMVGAYAATRQLPTLLTDIGAAAAGIAEGGAGGGGGGGRAWQILSATSSTRILSPCFLI
jgi:hypothetical protein